MRQVPNKAQPVQRPESRCEGHVLQEEQVSSLAKQVQTKEAAINKAQEIEWIFFLNLGKFEYGLYSTLSL